MKKRGWTGIYLVVVLFIIMIVFMYVFLFDEIKDYDIPDMTGKRMNMTGLEAMRCNEITSTDQCRLTYPNCHIVWEGGLFDATPYCASYRSRFAYKLENDQIKKEHLVEITTMSLSEKRKEYEKRAEENDVKIENTKSGVMRSVYRALSITDENIEEYISDYNASLEREREKIKKLIGINLKRDISLVSEDGKSMVVEITEREAQMLRNMMEIESVELLED